MGVYAWFACLLFASSFLKLVKELRIVVAGKHLPTHNNLFAIVRKVPYMRSNCGASGIFVKIDS